MGRKQIEIRGRKLVCPNFTLEHAMFFGTLLMSQDELRVFNEEENPQLAMEMMNDRFAGMDAELRSTLANELSEEEFNKQLNSAAIAEMVGRVVSRVNQDKDGIRYKLAKRLVEVFPDFPKSWVNPDAINLEPIELLQAVILPLFNYMNEQKQAAEAASTLKQEIAQVQPDRPASLGFGKMTVRETVTEDGAIVSAREVLSGLSPEVRQRLLQEVGVEAT